MVSSREEKKFWAKGYNIVVGLDEAGRGPLAGPVVASAVFVKDFKKHKDLSKIFLGVKDSKKLSATKREEFFRLISKNPFLDFGVGIVSEKVIDKINVLQATKLAMKEALEDLIRKNENFNVECLIIDGNFKLNNLDQTIIQKPIIKADEKVFSCVLAGIVAKVTRDRIMKKEHKKYPQYGFNRNKGYGTFSHLKNIEKFGACKIHRKTFAPIRNSI